jgi:hypothetical protein
MAASDQLFTKSLSDFEIKDADRGEVSAVVSVFDVVDRDGDVVLSGAIQDGATVKLSAYNHDVVTEGKPPVGKGVIRIDGKRAIFEGRYFMSTERGREAFASVKELGADSEWSIGYFKNVRTAPLTKDWSAKGARRLISELKTIETSPVFIGANQYTETLGVKAAQADSRMAASHVEAVKWLRAAIARHERHMNGTEATDDASQQTMMAEMMAALHALEMSDDDTGHSSKAADVARIAAIAKEVGDRMAAEQKAAADAAAEAERVEAETKAAAEAVALAEAKAAETAAAAREFETFARTMRKIA